MRDLASELLPALTESRIPGVDAGPGAVYPSYEGGSLVNLPSSVCRWLGAPRFGAPPLGPAILSRLEQHYRQVILLVIDGWGFNAARQVLEDARTDPDLAVWAELGEDAVFAPVTSLAPSTTAAALTSLWTGLPASAHGVAAYEVWLKEYGLIANMITHSPASYQGDAGSLRHAGFRPETFLPVPTLGPHLLEHGIKPYALQHISIARSGLSTMLFPGVEVLPFRTLGDLWATLGGRLEGSRSERAYYYIYWGELDEISHRFGPDDERARRDLAAFSLQLRGFLRQQRASRRGDTLFVITADHGHLATPRSPAYEVRSHPRLVECLAMYPSGEARMPFVYLKPGREEQFLAYLESAWPGEFRAVKSEQAVKAGLFGGEVTPAFYDRVGDTILFPQGSAYWWFSPERENILLGRHGGLSATEMLAPFLAVPL